MTIDDFREIALSLPDAFESAHMGHPDFRVRGKIFATIWPDEGWGMVKLTLQQQAMFTRSGFVGLLNAPGDGLNQTWFIRFAECGYGNRLPGAIDRDGFQRRLRAQRIHDGTRQALSVFGGS